MNTKFIKKLQEIKQYIDQCKSLVGNHEFQYKIQATEMKYLRRDLHNQSTLEYIEPIQPILVGVSTHQTRNKNLKK